MGSVLWLRKSARFVLPVFMCCWLSYDARVNHKLVQQSAKLRLQQEEWLFCTRLPLFPKTIPIERDPFEQECRPPRREILFILLNLPAVLVMSLMYPDRVLGPFSPYHEFILLIATTSAIQWYCIGALLARRRVADNKR
jgi:hypothetical protein